MRGYIVVVLIGASTLSACGAASPAPAVVAHGTLDLSQTLPAPTNTPFEAYGARQADSRQAVRTDAGSSIAPYLRPQRARLGPASTHRPALTARPASKRDAPSDSQGVLPTTRASRGPLLATSAEVADKSIAKDAERYAQRQSRQAETYRGGDGIVITASTLIIILLVVVLVLLLT